jgi:hypothetical protein
MTNEGTKELTREEIRALANAVLDTLGIEDVERSDEEWEALRRAIRERRKPKANEEDV